mgnify:CR=1 FL=1
MGRFWNLENANTNGGTNTSIDSQANADSSKGGTGKGGASSGRASGSRTSSFDGTSAGGKLKHDFLYLHERQDLGLDGFGADVGSLSGCFKSARRQLSNLTPRRAASPRHDTQSDRC